MLMTDENDALLPNERRSYFRIDDVVKLSCRTVLKAELPELIERLKIGIGSNFTVMSNFAAMSQQMLVQLRQIENTTPDIAACIKLLDQKLDILGRAFLLQEQEVSDQVAKAVNLSAGGMAFGNAEAHKVGAILEIKLLLLPDMAGMMIYGEVVDCAKNAAEDCPDEPHYLRIAFSNIREADRDILIRHVLRRQGEWLRKRRKDNEETNDETE